MYKVKRGFSFILSLIIVLSCIDTQVFAEQSIQDAQYVAMDEEWLTVEKIMAGNIYSDSAEIIDEVSYTAINTVNGNLDLPATGGYCSINWFSDNESFITAAGLITQPSYLEAYEYYEDKEAFNGNVPVTLTATLAYGDATDEKTFHILVPALSETEEETEVIALWTKVYEDCSALEAYLESGYDYVYLDSLNKDMHLPTVITDLNNIWCAQNGSTVAYTSSNGSLLSIDTTEFYGYVTGFVNRPSYTEGDKNVTLMARVSQSDVIYHDITFDITVKSLYPDDSESVGLAKEWLTDELILNGNSLNHVENSLYLPEEFAVDGEYGTEYCTIGWISSDETVIKTDGRVIRPAQNSQTVTLTATITKNSVMETKSLTVEVASIEQSVLALRFDDFTHAGKILQSNGESSINDSSLEFINNESGGSVFTKNRIHLNDNLSFSTAFAFSINADANWGNYGDGGFTFTLQSAGCTACYSCSDDTNSLGIKGIKPSVSIEFDTRYWKEENVNTGSQQTNVYHADEDLGVFVNGDCNSLVHESFSLNSYPLYLKVDGTQYYVWIEYDGTFKYLEIRISGDSTRPDEATYTIQNIDLKKLLADDNSLTVDQVQDMYAGFTGSAGNMTTENDEILSWYFKNDSIPINFDHYAYTDASVVAVSAAADGNTGDCTISAKVTGNGGVPAAEVPVSFSASAGSFESCTAVTDSAGMASVVMHMGESGLGVEAKAVAEGGMTGSAVFDFALTPQYVVSFDINWLTDSVILNGNSSLSSVLTDLYLPTEGQALYNDGGINTKSTISWISDSVYLSSDGKVTNPSAEDGDQTVSLTARVTLDSASVCKDFTVTIKVKDMVNAQADRDWLTDDVILGGNSALDDVTVKLNLLTVGPNGSIISWITADEALAASDGTVTRPPFVQGDKEVTLTATITKGLAELRKSFVIKVKAEGPNDTEAVEADRDWLTDDVILGDYNGSIDNITNNLNLPNLGLKGGSVISWESSDANFIANDGKVTCPAFSQGAKTVTLTATITHGGESAQKTFELTIMTLDQTDEELVAADMEWLDASRTLGGNLSQNSVTRNLSLPASAPGGSSIVWVSDTSALISSGGTVTRPGYREGYKTAILNATLTKGSATDSKTFTYTVLALPDTDSPIVVSATPAQDSTGVSWNTKKIFITFDENIKQGTQSDISGDNSFGMELQSSVATKIVAMTVGNTLVVMPRTYMAAGVNRLIVPAGAVTDESGNPVEAFELSFTVEDKLVNHIEVISSSPQNSEKQVPIDTDEIIVAYNTAEIAEGDSFENISLSDETGGAIPVTPTLNEDKVTLKLGAAIKSGTVYKIDIPSGAVQDRFENKSTEKTIRFKTATDDTPPQITAVYPANRQNHVDILQSIEVSFSEQVKPSDCNLTLRDSLGNVVRTYISNRLASEDSVVLTPYSPLNTNTEYIVSGPYDSMLNPEQLDFCTSFTTGENALGIQKTSPEADTTAVPVDAKLEIRFSSPITASPAADSIELQDSQGNPVVFHAAVSADTAVLTPDTELTSSESYTLCIPAGVYESAGGGVNDAYSFGFTTAARLEPDVDAICAPSVWFAGKPITFDTDRVKTFFKSAGYEMVSYTWNFGDGNTGGGENPAHQYNQLGNYTVILNAKDNKGFSYEFDHMVAIEDLHDIEMTVIPSGNNALYLNGSTMPTQLYTVRLECDGQFIPEEMIRVQLFKDGVCQADYPSLTAGSEDDAYLFSFKPSILDFGTYELVFTYENQTEQKKVCMPVMIYGYQMTGPLRIRLYDLDTGRFFETPDSITIELDDVNKIAVKEWQDDIKGYAYVVNDDFQVGQSYTLKVDGWVLKNDYTIAGGDLYHPDIIYGNTVDIGICKVTADLGAGASEMPLLIKGADTGSVTFKVEGDWNNLNPAYYELKTDDGCFDIKSSSSKITFNLGKSIKTGKYLMVRMVSKEGIMSSWQCVARIAPKPTFMGHSLNVSLVDGQYRLSVPTGLEGVMGGSISLLDGIPLLDGGRFGISGDDMPSFGGYIDDNEAILNFDSATGYGETTKTTKDTKSKKVKKVKSAGYDINVGVGGELCLVYDFDSNEWDLSYAIIDLEGFDGISKTKGYEIPKIHVGADLTLKMGVDVEGILQIDESSGNDSKYSGIIRITPISSLSIQLGFSYYNVTGSVTGAIPTEIDYPTGYIGADVSITARIIGTFVTYSKTFYEKTLYHAHWDNGKQKLVLKAVALAAFQPDTEEPGFEPITRDYLSRGSDWVAGAPASMMMLSVSSDEGTTADQSNLQNNVMMENIYPQSEVRLVQSSDGLWMVWTDDNPEREAANRTQLQYSVLKDGVWSEPAWLDSDGTADFNPAVASSGSGTLMAWQNIKKAVTEQEGLAVLVENSEISVTESVFSLGGDSPQVVTLTDDDKYDYSPRLAADGNNALLVWIKSEEVGADLNTEKYLSPSNKESLFFSRWDGSTWSAPTEIEGSLPTVLDSSLAMSGDEGLLLYTLDMDNDLSTQEDREVFARVYNGISWGEAIALTSNQVEDSNPKAVCVDGDWFITWYQNGNIMYKNSLNGEDKIAESLQNMQSNYEISVKQGIAPLVALTCKHLGENQAQGLSVFFYDIAKGVWSNEILLADAEGYAGSFSPVFTEDGKLNVAYSRAEIISEVIDGGEQQTVSDKVDLRILAYTPVHDLAFNEESGFLLSPEIPLPGTTDTVLVTVENEGDFAENAIVDFYDEDPENGGAKIGEAVTSQPIPAHSSVQMQIDWQVGMEERNEYHIYAVVRPGEGVQETDEDNNTISLDILTSDIAITDVECKNLAGDDYLVTATVANTGSKTLEGARVWLEQTDSGEALDSESINSLKPGQEVVLQFLVSSQNLTKNSSGTIDITLQAALPDGVNEYSTGNNICKFTLNLTSIAVESVNPGQGDKQVDVNTPLTLKFNMNVEKGAGFDQIALEDDNLNKIDMEKALEGDILTVTPKSALEHGARYTLTIPEDAVGDTYGHTMDKAYGMSFTTVSDRPEVIFTYPGDQMVNAEPNTDIRLKYNQNLQKGLDFTGITLDGPDSEEIPVTMSAQGQWLYIDPAGILAESTVYLLTVPRGAVQNDGGEAQQEDYTLEFMTADTNGNSSDDTDSSSSNNTGNQAAAYTASITTAGSTHADSLPVIVDIDKGSAVIELEDMAEKIFSGDENTVISIPSISSVSSYTLEIPAVSLSGSYGKGSLTFGTGVGSILVPSGMLSEMTGLDGKTVSITIAVGDKTKLSDDVKASIGDRPIVQLTMSLDGVQTDWNNPSTPVTVSIPYTPTATELSSPESIIIWYIGGNGKAVSVQNGHYDPVTGTVTFSTTHFSDYAVAYNKVNFNDVAPGAWYNKAVRFIAARGITTGTGNGNYSPELKLTRGEFIVLMMRAYCISPDTNPTDNFSDAGSTYYTGYLAAAKRLGISAGVGNNLYAPDKEITRQEMFTLLYNVLKAIDRLPQGDSGKTLSDFSDYVQIDAWAKDAMTLLVKVGTINGNSGKLIPLSTTTRAEMAQVLYNLLGK